MVKSAFGVAADAESWFRYQCLKMNVDILRVIQIGITFSDDDGNFPTDSPSTWQFHFSFSLHSDTCAPSPAALASSCTPVVCVHPHAHTRAATRRTPYSCYALQVVLPSRHCITLQHVTCMSHVAFAFSASFCCFTRSFSPLTHGRRHRLCAP